MTFLLELKEKLRKIYIDFGYIILPVLKFALAMIVFSAINNTIGFLDIFKNIFVVLIMALICSLLSVKVTAFFAGLMILGHCYALGIEVAVIAFAVFLLLFIFALRFSGKENLALVLTPLAFSIGIPCAVPVCFGLKSKPYSAISICCGTFVYYFVNMIQDKAPVLQGSEQATFLTNVRLLLDGIIKDKMMIFSLIVLALVLIVVYALRRLPIDHSWSIAICVGAACYLVCMIAGGLFMDLEISMVTMSLGAIGAAMVGIALQFLVLSVDYTRTERLEFEDDEYYYYVKAVPKMTITKAERQIKTISSEESDNLLGNNREATDYNQNDLERKLEESLKEL